MQISADEVARMPPPDFHQLAASASFTQLLAEKCANVECKAVYREPTLQIQGSGPGQAGKLSKSRKKFLPTTYKPFSGPPCKRLHEQALATGICWMVGFTQPITYKYELQGILFEYRAVEAHFQVSHVPGLRAVRARQTGQLSHRDDVVTVLASVPLAATGLPESEIQ